MLNRTDTNRHYFFFKLNAALLTILFVASFQGANAEESKVDPVRFENVARSGGVDFILQNYITEEKHMIETMVGGVATLDYNNDGLLDIYFTNGSVTPSMKKEDPKFYNRLYRNDGDFKRTQGRGFN